MIENYLTVCVVLVLDNDTHTVLTRLIADISDTLNSLVLNKISHCNAKLLLVDLVGDLGDDNSVLFILDLGLCADHNMALTRAVSLLDSLCAVNSRGGGEIGALNVLHQLLKATLGVFHTVNCRVNYLSKIVSWDICRHTYGNTDSSVYKQVGEL